MYRLAITVFSAFIAFIMPGHAQNAVHTAKADSLMGEYRFEEALGCLEDMAAAATDSAALAVLQGKILRCRNAIALAEFVSSPRTVAAENFHKDSFFLYLPLAERSWRICPNNLVQNRREDFPSAFYHCDGDDVIVFTDKTETGQWGLFSTERINDTLWTYPSAVDEGAFSSGNVLFPMLSPDGKSLYFASDGLYGMGGYDLYVSHRDEKTGKWGVPENLGFPYSSPFNDILFAISENGKYCMTVSDRTSGGGHGTGDSVRVYVMEYEPLAIKRKIQDPEELKAAASLEPATSAPTAVKENPVQSGKGMEKYSAVLKEIRSLRDSLSKIESGLKTMREKYIASSADENMRASIRSGIEVSEAAMVQLRAESDRLNAELAAIEMDFLANGVVIDPDKALENIGNKGTGQQIASKGFVFERHIPGGDFEIMVEKPVKQFDYSFQILPVGRFAEDNRLPDGLIYQIQIFASAAPAGVKDLGGLSPVFMRNPSKGKYIYSVGVFETYDQARSNLGKVRSRGFGSAFINAFYDGEKISVAEGREMERKGVPSEYMVCILSPDGSLDETASEIIKAGTSMDIIRTLNENGTVYMVGPFKTKAEAEKLAGKLIASDVKGISVEKQE